MVGIDESLRLVQRGDGWKFTGAAAAGFVPVDEHLANQQPITFTQVVASTGLGRTRPYRNPSPRALIEKHRHGGAQAGTLPSLADDITARRCGEAVPVTARVLVG